MEYFSKYAGNINKVASRHEKSFVKSLFKGFVKEPFASVDWKKQNKDVRRYESAEFRLAKIRERAWKKDEAQERKLYNRKNW